jgi:hypothetical protein
LHRCRFAVAGIADAGEERSVEVHIDAPRANLWLSWTRLRNTRLMRRSEPQFAGFGQPRVAMRTDAEFRTEDGVTLRLALSAGSRQGAMADDHHCARLR